VSGSLTGSHSPRLWSIEIPQLTLIHPFLLTGILAVTALHLSTLYPNRKRELHTLAIAKETAALPTFRRNVTFPNGENIHATFAFAGSIIFYMMVSPDVLYSGVKVNRCRLPSRSDEHPHWFMAVRGVVVLFKNNHAELSKGPFASLLFRNPLLTFAWNNPDYIQLEKLEGMFEQSSPPSTSVTSQEQPLDSFPHLSSQDDRDRSCRKALDQLRIVSALPYATRSTFDLKVSVHIWPGCIEQDFLELIFDRDPKALVILAHYCVVLKKSNCVWYLRGLGTELLNSIKEELSEEWKPWIKWALDHTES